MRALTVVPLVDGSELRLLASVNALCDFEADLTRAGFDPVRELARIESGRGGTLSAIRALVWACARAQHPGLAVHHVGDLLQQNGDSIREGLLMALSAAAPEPDPAGDPQGKMPPPSE